MRLPLSLFIALRYLLASRHEGYLSLIAWFSLLGMTLGVAALLVVTSVMNGFEQQLQQRILNVVPHIFVSTNTAQAEAVSAVVAAQPAVLAVAPYKRTDGVANMNGVMAGVVINGVEPSSLGTVSSIPRSLLMGDMDLLKPKTYRVVIGRGLAAQLGSYVGDKITLILPELSRTPAGVFPRSRRFIVSGIFEAGAQVDLDQVYIHIDDFDRLMPSARATTAFRLQLDNVLAATVVASALRTELGSETRVEDWSMSHGGLFQAVKVEKLMVAVLLAIIVLVAAFNIVAVLTMMVINKRSAIAVLQTMGASRATIIRIFMLQGFLLGSAGVLLGLAIGLPIALHIGAIMAGIEQVLGATLFDANVFYIVQLPSDVRYPHVAYVMALGLTTSMLATVYPALRASAVPPSEVLRYE